MIYFAYDGSIDGDWVSRYAMHMASNSAERQLVLIHVVERGRPPLPEEKLQRIEYECRLLDVGLRCLLPACGESISSTIIDEVGAQIGRQGPSGGNIVVCGTRTHQPRRRGYLHGTVAEPLLRHPAFHTVAFRVLHPGLLGVPHDLLLPVSIKQMLSETCLPALQLIAPSAHNMHILHLVEEGSLLHRLTSGRLIAQLEAASRKVQEMEEFIAAAADIRPERIDTTVRPTGDWPREVIVRAGRHKSQLIFMGLPTCHMLHHLFHRCPVERVLREAPCDVAIYGECG